MNLSTLLAVLAGVILMIGKGLVIISGILTRVKQKSMDPSSCEAGVHQDQCQAAAKKLKQDTAIMWYVGNGAVMAGAVVALASLFVKK